jgi:azurin
MMRTTICVLVSAAALACAGCKDKESHASTIPRPPPAATAAAPQAPATQAAAPQMPTSDPPKPEPAKGDVVEIEIASVGDTMAFDKKTLTVPAGSTVHLVLKNHGTIAAMTHNWVLVKPGTEAKVAAAGLEKGPAGGYFAQTDDVLAATPLAQPKADAEITFKAPEPGKYPYICTFPGHYVVMKGELTVTP